MKTRAALILASAILLPSLLRSARAFAAAYAGDPRNEREAWRPSKQSFDRLERIVGTIQRDLRADRDAAAEREIRAARGERND